MNIDNLLPYLRGVKPLSGSAHYVALCPCHDDHKPSLDVTERDGKILMTCPVCGANGSDVMNALGIGTRELFGNNNTDVIPTKRSAWRNPHNVQQTSGDPSTYARDDRVTTSTYARDDSAFKRTDYYYSDELKKTRFYVWDEPSRSYKKTFCWYHRGENGRQVKGLPKDKNGKKVSVPLYKQGNIAIARERLETVYIVEGEKDVDTMTNELGLFAVCSPHGAGKGKLEKKWNSEYNELFKGVSVALIPDNDDPGRELANYIASQIEPFADEVKILDLKSEWDFLKEKGDITDVYEQDKPIGNMSLAGSIKFRLDALRLVTKPYEQPKPSVDSGKYICLSDVDSKPTEWLWHPYIPKGKVTIISADPGTGKTFLSLYLTAQVSTGRPFFTQAENDRREPAVAVYQTAEDGISDTIKPRLEPMEPDFSNIYIFNEQRESLSFSSEHVEEIMRDLHPALMVFDPLQAYLGANVDMHRANEIRPVLTHLGNLAEKYDCAVVIVAHNSKSNQTAALLRTLGSVDIVAVARSTIILAKDPDSPNGVIMCHEKSSLSVRGKSLLLEINPSRGGVLFSGYSPLTADELLSRRPNETKRSSAKLDDTVDKLLEKFGENDYLKIESVDKLREELGCSQSTLQRAKKELEIKSIKKGFGGNSVNYWMLPECDSDFENEETEFSNLPTD